jgi:thiol-disulfide isomerase/thioredoxin
MNLIIENDSPDNNHKFLKINEHIRNKYPIVIYFYKDGCPYCIETTKEWNKIPPQNKQNLLVVKINKLFFDKFNNIGEPAKTYPNIRYVHNNKVFVFKKEGIDRNAVSLERWINQLYSMTNKKVHFPENNHKYNKILRKQTPFHKPVLRSKTFKHHPKKHNKTRSKIGN